MRIKMKWNLSKSRKQLNYCIRLKVLFTQKCSKNILPYFKRARNLLFERQNLIQWIREEKKETTDEAETKINKAFLVKKICRT